MQTRFNDDYRKRLLQTAQECLWSKEGEVAKYYLLDKRYISEDTIKEFGIGYIPSNVEHQLNGRIIIPLYDASNNLIALSSRLINDSKDNALPVYWHESYEKNLFVFGLNNSKQHIRQEKYAIVVEGQFDAMQLYNHGITNVVALCGTSFSKIQLSILLRYANKVLFLLDRDKNLSGQRAVLKILRPDLQKEYIMSMSDLTLERHITAKRKYSLYAPRIAAVLFKENIDPDKFVIQHGVDRLRKLINTKLIEIGHQNVVSKSDR